MEVYGSLEEARGRLPGCAVAIGNFDGVHLGHRALIDTARALASPRGAATVALTFEPHPAKVLSSAIAPPLVTTLPRKLQLLEAAGVDAVVVQPFDRDYAATTAEEFARRDLLGRLDARDVVVGFDFTFGRGRAGDVPALSRLLERQATVHVVPAVRAEGWTVSSSKIRELVLTGRVAAAARLLGRPFLLDGTVVPGHGRGRTIGLPTANIAPATELLPATGVYAVQAIAPGLARPTPGAANIGVKPTFGVEELTVEVHLLDVSPDLYGQPIAVAFLERLRGEERFPDVDALLAQIQVDLAEARRLASVPPDPAVVLPPAPTPRRT
jgi:riboflavin kinase/FMN adenylyltransferase